MQSANMPNLTFRQRIASIPNPVILTMVVGVVFIFAGIGRGVSYIMAGLLSLILAGVGYYWYKRNGDRFNIKFLDQISGTRQITERQEADLEVEMRYVNNPGYHPALDSEYGVDGGESDCDRLRGGVSSHPHGRDTVLMHGPSRDDEAFNMRVAPMSPPPYSAINQDQPVPPGTLPPPGSLPISDPNLPSSEFPNPPSGNPPPLPSPSTAPPSYDSIYPENNTTTSTPTTSTPASTSSAPQETTTTSTTSTSVT